MWVQMRSASVDYREMGLHREARAEVAFSTPPYMATSVTDSSGNLSISSWLDQRLRNPPPAARAIAAAARRCYRAVGRVLASCP